jgi:hypothetical protein
VDAVGAKRFGERRWTFCAPDEIDREARAACVAECQKPKALKRLFAGFVEQLMGNIIRKEPMAGRFPKIVGFQTAICDGFNIFRRIAKLRRCTI